MRSAVIPSKNQIMGGVYIQVRQIGGSEKIHKKEIGTAIKKTGIPEPISEVLSAVSSTYGKNNNDALSREIREMWGGGNFFEF